MSGISVAQYRLAAQFIQGWRSPLLVSHTKPDGDAIGSLVALRGMFRQLGVAATVLVFEDIPSRYAVLNGAAPFAKLGTDVAQPALDSFDSVVVADTCTYNQIEPIADWLKSSTIPKLAIDHHRTRNDLADLYLIDETAAANCLILHDWLNSRSATWEFDQGIGEALFVGIATDTGWFRHSNTDARALAVAAELVEKGVDAHRLFEALYHCDSEGRVRLLGRAIDSMELHANGRLAIMTLGNADFLATGASASDTEDIVNEPLRMATTVASVLLVEQEDGLVRASFRSRTPTQGIPDIDVAAVAQGLGGGGHSRAAGARLSGPLTTAKELVLQCIRPRLSDEGS